MLELTKAVLAMMIGFICAVVFGLIAVPLLKKIAKQKVSSYLERKHKEKEGTPTMGGIIFIIPTFISIIILVLMDKMQFSANLLIVMFVFLAYATLGFIDDFLIIKRQNNNGLTEFQKLVGQLFIALVFFYIFMANGADPVLDIHTLGIKIDMGWLYGIFLLFVLIASSNAVNITDGLDGLAGGLSVMAFLAFGLICWNSGAISDADNLALALFCFVLVGSLMGFLVYNTHPAKVFMGDTGALSLGATLASIAIITQHEVTMIVVAGVFVFETLVCIIQIISMVYFKRKVFLMTPYHHHLEKKGWDERDIVKLFWVIGLILSMSAIIFGVWI